MSWGNRPCRKCEEAKLKLHQVDAAEQVCGEILSQREQACQTCDGRSLKICLHSGRLLDEYLPHRAAYCPHPGGSRWRNA